MFGKLQISLTCKRLSVSWHANGKVFVFTSEGAPAIVIRCQDDFFQLTDSWKCFYALVFLVVAFFSMNLFLYVRNVKMAIANCNSHVSGFLFGSLHSFVQFRLFIFISVKKKRLLSLRQYSTRHLRLDLTFMLPVVIYLHTAYTLVRVRCSKSLTALHTASHKIPAICARHWCSARDFTLTLTRMLSRYLCPALCNCVFIVLSRQSFSNKYPRLTTVRFMLHKRLNKHTNPHMISDALRHLTKLHFDVHSTKNKFLLRVQVFIFLSTMCNNREMVNIGFFPSAPKPKALQFLVKACSFPNFQHL